MMPKIRKVKRYEGVHVYFVEKVKNMHGNFCSLLKELGFDDQAVGEFDFLYEDTVEEHVLAQNADYDIELVFSEEIIYFIIRTEKNQLALHDVIKKYFLC